MTIMKSFRSKDTEKEKEKKQVEIPSFYVVFCYNSKENHTSFDDK